MEKNSSSFELELRGIRKTFGDCVAVENVSLSVKKGEIHAVVGENGAGKSTAMKILYGQYSPDQGEIFIRGKQVQWRSSADAIAAGIGMVHQHFMLAGPHSAVDNVLLTAGGSAFGLLPRKDARARLESLMQKFHLQVNLDLPVEKLSVGEQQRVEILKLLYCDSEILILDEPTAVLAPVEIEALFATLRDMAASGKTILVITHKLKEVLALADQVTVFRAGKVIGTRQVAGITVGELAAMMIGRELKAGEEEARPPAKPEIVLEVKAAHPVADLSRLGELSFRLHAGEILGIAGVEGNGQSELIRLLLDPAGKLRTGEINLLGKNVSRCTPKQLRGDSGLAIFPEDRLREALLLEDNVEDNFLLGRQRLAKFRRKGFFLDRHAQRKATLAALNEFDVRPRDPFAMAGSLSGGNQQKLVVARELSERPRFLIAAQPTRGVDIGAIEFIHERIRTLRDSGSGILLISSELEEVLKLSDRLLVVFGGKIVGSFLRGDFDEKKIGLLMTGETLRGAS